MPRSRLVRVQLALLALVVVLVLGRSVFKDDGMNAPVVLSDLEPHRLAHAAFSLDRAARIVVQAAGSVEQAEDAAPLAAYAWITRRDTREVVWRQAPGADRAGTLVRSQEVVSLEGGVYDLYFAGYGNRMASRSARSFFSRIVNPRERWQGDHEDWHVLVRPANVADGGPRVERLYGDAARPSAEGTPGLVWTSGPMEDRDYAEHVFEVVRPVEARVYAVGEIGDEAFDYGWIERLATGERIWSLESSGEPAGGADVNRRARADLGLAPGLYRAVYRTDGGHAFDDWYANPPSDPFGWGLTLALSDADAADAVRPFDPFLAREALVSLTRITDDHLASTQFVVTRPTQFIVYAVGEVTSGGVYDYAWITSNATEQRVWEMSRERTRPAGGADKNRLEEAFLSLQPGTYTLYYQTDGSHAYGDWNAPRPENPERWGVTLFPAEANLAPGTVEVLHRRRERGASGAFEPAVPSAPAPPVARGDVLVDHTQLRNDRQVQSTFELDAPTRILIRAAGEINLRGRYDWGGIERADTGETVWEMTWQNTRPAGGADRNRFFEGTVVLPPGRYAAFFRTDLSHAFGDFVSEAPFEPAAWGLFVARLEEVD